MISRAHADFWKCFNALPGEIQESARARFALWRRDAFNAALHFKPLFADVWSVRIIHGYRAVGRRRGNLIVWFWIGSHPEYEQLLKRL